MKLKLKIYLKMVAVYAVSNAAKQRDHDLLELRHSNNFQYLLQLTQEHHLLLGIRNRPVFQQPHNHATGQLWFFFNKLYHTKRQLIEVNCQRF